MCALGASRPSVEVGRVETRHASDVMHVGAPGRVTVVSTMLSWPKSSHVSLDGSLLVANGGTLRIGAGARIEAAPGVAVVVERSGQLQAHGTALEPIVWTCQGGASIPGCWEGVTILGNASINHGTFTSPAGQRGGAGGCREALLDATQYGGCDAGDDSGVLRYARVQYATHGLRLYGVGSATTLEDIQVHRSLGDGLDVVGGSAILRRLVLTTNAQYGLHYSGGWTGEAQYVVVQQDPTAYVGGLLGQNGRGANGDPDAAPRSAPTLANITVVAPVAGEMNAGGGTSPAALRFERGAAGRMYNVLLIEPAIAVDIDDASTCMQLNSGALRIQGAGVTAPVTVADPDSDPSSCMPLGEGDLLAGATMVVGAAASRQLEGALDIVLPDLRPAYGSVIDQALGVSPPVTGSLETSTSLGAVGGSGMNRSRIPWYSGWTIGERLAPSPRVAVTGIVSSPSHQTLGGITVTLAPSGVAAMTDEGGQFTLPNVPAGPAELTLTAGVPAYCLTPPSLAFVAALGSRPLQVRLPCEPSTTRLPSVIAGGFHTCGLDVAGYAFCWGWGQMLGAGAPATPDQPLPVSGGLRFSKLAAAETHTCGVSTDGATYCWGSNRFGELGDLTTVARFAPVRVRGGIDFAAVAVAWRHSCGLTSGGRAYCWGTGAVLGDGTVQPSLVPVPVAGGMEFTSIVSRFRHTCGLSSEGLAYCWGDNTFGQLGDSTTGASLIPVAVKGALSFASLSAGDNYVCGLSKAGVAYCWGWNDHGRLGDGTITDRLTPVPVNTSKTFVLLTAGGDHACGLVSSGEAYCWGANDYGQIGDGTKSARLSPVPVLTNTKFVALFAGQQHTCGLSDVGAAYCWGDNSLNQLGDGTSSGVPSTVPTAVTGGIVFRVP